MCVYIHTVGGDSHSSLAVWLAWSLPISKCSCSVPSNDSIKHIVREFSFYHLSERKQNNQSCGGVSARPIPVRMHRGGGELSDFGLKLRTTVAAGAQPGGGVRWSGGQCGVPPRHWPMVLLAVAAAIELGL
jgi:hypothetical protein